MTTKKTNKPKVTSPAYAAAIASYDALAESVKLKLLSVSVEKNPNVPDWDADHWKVTLSRGKKKLVTYYSKVHAHEGEAPTMEEVLCCLAIDARILEKSKTYEKWLSEYTWEDTARSKRIFADCKRVTGALQGLLGPDEFKALLAIDAKESTS